MKIAFFTEMGFEGKIPRTHINMRVEFAWMCALDAYHYSIGTIPSEPYDLAMVLNSKTKPGLLNIQKLKSKCEIVSILQEGPNWGWQDYALEHQIHYYNNLIAADIIYTHNSSDAIYYRGLTNHSDVRVLPSLMIEDNIPKEMDSIKSGVMVGGNMTSWYGGFDSMVIAQELGEQIYAPSMGRKIDKEEELDIIHYPYMDWTEWITQLNNRRYAVHLMRTHAAGTFALNCAYLGIPCIGYKGLDTQEICNPETTVDIGDLKKAREIAKELRNNEKFYLHCSNIAKQKYKEHYHENIFNTTFKKQFKIP